MNYFNFLGCSVPTSGNPSRKSNWLHCSKAFLRLLISNNFSFVKKKKFLSGSGIFKRKNICSLNFLKYKYCWQRCRPSSSVHSLFLTKILKTDNKNNLNKGKKGPLSWTQCSLQLQSLWQLESFLSNSFRLTIMSAHHFVLLICCYRCT